MQLTKHRDKFSLEMSSEELVFLVNVLGSDPVSTEQQEKVTKALKELTKFQVFYQSLEEYIQKQEALLDK